MINFDTANFKRSLVVLAITGVLNGCFLDGDDGAEGAQGAQGEQGDTGTPGSNGNNGQDLTALPKLTRIATVPVGAEVTGLYLTDNDQLFFNVQHPSDLNGDATPARVGFVKNLDWSALDPRSEALSEPLTDEEKLAVRIINSAEYQTIGSAEDTLNSALPFGLGAIVSGDGNSSLKQSQDPDFNAFLATDIGGNEGYLFTAWEDRPGAMSRIQLTMTEDGSWQVDDAMTIDFLSVGGTMINCFGTMSPWGTPLTAEENYEAENVANWNNPAYSGGYPNYADVKLIQQYNGAGAAYPNPYNFGYVVEITNPASASPVPVKHYTLGRVAHENAVVMPDLKTVYTSDDGTGKAFYKFVADNAGDLSAGTLYAAKLVQDATQDPIKAGFNISWVELGSGNNAQISGWIDEYNNIDETDYVDGANSYISEAEITDWATNGTGDDRYAFLETLKAAKAKGATTEFRKMEGVVINYNGAASGALPFMYVTMSAVEATMTDGIGDIQLDSSAKCGAVYRFGLHPDYNVTRMEPVVVSGAYNSAGDANGNKCDVNGISNPDNLALLDDGRLIIGEDTSKHVNNAIWMYNPKGE